MTANDVYPDQALKSIRLSSLRTLRALREKKACFTQRSPRTQRKKSKKRTLSCDLGLGKKTVNNVYSLETIGDLFLFFFAVSLRTLRTLRETKCLFPAKSPHHANHPNRAYHPNRAFHSFHSHLQKRRSGSGLPPLIFTLYEQRTK